MSCDIVGRDASPLDARSCEEVNRAFRGVLRYVWPSYASLGLLELTTLEIELGDDQRRAWNADGTKLFEV